MKERKDIVGALYIEDEDESVILCSIYPVTCDLCGLCRIRNAGISDQETVIHCRKHLQ